MACETKLLVVDDLYFLRWRNTSGVEISNHFKYVANEFPVTLIFVGVGLARQRSVLRGFLVRGRGDRANWEADHQAGHAPVHHRHRRGPIRLPPDVAGVKKRIVLADKRPGMLADELSDYLFARSTGHIGSLTLINRGCQRAVRTGAERLDRDLLDRVENDAASEKGRQRSILAASPPGSARLDDRGAHVADRVAPIDGEALDSWLEAIAHRTHTAFGDVLSAAALTGHHDVRTGAWMVRLEPDQVAAISEATGISEATIHTMTMAHYAGRALRINPDTGTVSRAFPWGVASDHASAQCV